MPVLLGAVLVVGEISDATVLYVAVPAIAVVCLYRIIAARKIRTADTVILAAAVVSVPVADLVRAGLVRLGAYWMIAPRVGLAFSRIPHNAALTWQALRVLFGSFSPLPGFLAGPGASGGGVLGSPGVALGYACMLAAAFGFGKVIWTWRTASRAEQLLCVAIVVNIAAYMFSTAPVAGNAREVVAVVPCSAVLAARALIPRRLAARTRSRVIAAVAAAAAIVPLAATATLPAITPPANSLAAWLQAHGLRYGIAGYWNASAITLTSRGYVQVRAVSPRYPGVGAKDWETKAFWYDPTRHYANFAIASTSDVQTYNSLPVALFETHYGKPAAIHLVVGTYVLIYRKNLLRDFGPPLPFPPRPAPAFPAPGHIGAPAPGPGYPGN